MQADFSQPSALAQDSAGNIYVADANNYAIRKIDPAGIIATIAGNGKQGNSPDGASAAGSPIYRPEALAIEPDGSLLFAEVYSSYRRVRRMGTDGKLATLADSLLTSFVGGALVSDGAGGFLYADSSARKIRRYSRETGANDLAGSGDADSGGEIFARWLSLIQPDALALGSDGSIYVVDSRADRVYMLAPRW